MAKKKTKKGAVLWAKKNRQAMDSVASEKSAYGTIDSLHRWTFPIFTTIISLFITIIIFILTSFLGPLVTTQEQIKQLNKQNEKILDDMKTLYQNEIYMRQQILALEIEIEHLRSCNNSLTTENKNLQVNFGDMERKVIELEVYNEFQKLENNIENITIHPSASK